MFSVNDIERFNIQPIRGTIALSETVVIPADAAKEAARKLTDREHEDAKGAGWFFGFLFGMLVMAVFSVPVPGNGDYLLLAGLPASTLIGGLIGPGVRRTWRSAQLHASYRSAGSSRAEAFSSQESRQIDCHEDMAYLIQDARNSILSMEKSRKTASMSVAADIEPALNTALDVFTAMVKLAEDSVGLNEASDEFHTAFDALVYGSGRIQDLAEAANGLSGISIAGQALDLGARIKGMEVYTAIFAEDARRNNARERHTIEAYQELRG